MNKDDTALCAGGRDVFCDDSSMLLTPGLLFSWLQLETSESSKCDFSHWEVEAGGLKFEVSLG